MSIDVSHFGRSSLLLSTCAVQHCVKKITISDLPDSVRCCSLSRFPPVAPKDQKKKKKNRGLNARTRSARDFLVNAFSLPGSFSGDFRDFQGTRYEPRVPPLLPPFRPILSTPLPVVPAGHGKPRAARCFTYAWRVSEHVAAKWPHPFT